MLSAPEKPLALPRRLLDISTIYHELDIENFRCTQEILARFPNAQRIEVPSHWKIPSLHGNEGSASDWLQIRRNILVLGARKSLRCEPNTRPSDFIAPEASTGTFTASKAGANPVANSAGADALCAHPARKLAHVA